VSDPGDHDPEAHDDEGKRPSEPTTPEGVRIIGAEEAQAALEGGQVSRRLGEDDLRYGDVPPRPDPGVRPAARFPLPADVSTPKPRVSPPRAADEAGEPPVSGSHTLGELDRDGSPRHDESGHHDEVDLREHEALGDEWPEAVWSDGWPAEGETRPLETGPPEAERPETERVVDHGDEPAVRVPPEEPSGPMPLPHWTEPPTGEIPQLLPEAEPVDITAEEDDAWSSLTTGAPRFRSEAEDWAEGDFDFGASLRDDSSALGALAHEVDDDVVFEQQVAARRTRRDGRDGRGGRERDRERARENVPPRRRVADDGAGVAPAASGVPGGGDLPTRIVTGIAIAVLALICLKFGRGTATALVAVIVGLATLEIYEAFRRVGHRPASVIGFLGSVTLVVAAYKRGVRAYPDVAVLVVVFSMLWYLVGVVRSRVTVNLGMTILGFAYVGGLGGFAGLLLTTKNGVGLVLGMAICAVGYDLFGYFVGSQFGRTRIAPDISPNKTLEGLLAGMSAAIVLGVIVSGVFKLTPWDGKVSYGLGLGVIVAIMAPLGDLCESLIKRDLGLKDLGSILPGHGGVLDRFDAMLFCLPAVYYLARYLGIG
jgi:phosphatidate cytidylyltransferase